MKLEFDEKGNAIWPKLSPEVKLKLKEQLDKIEKNPKVIVTYEKIDENWDRWNITIPKNVPEKLLSDIKNWCDKKQEIEYGNAKLIKKEDSGAVANTDIGSDFILDIRGLKRCLYGHTFLNGLQTKLLTELDITIIQKNTCQHYFYVVKPKDHWSI